MGLRAGANKASAKKQPFSDFKKKTAKVGRKVKSSNVTKIDVTSKRIQIPLQSQITATKPENEQENLGLLLKTLQHYNGPARTTALEDLKELLATSPSTEFYISLIFPPALELLFDDERDTRKALVALLTSLLTRFPSNSFLSIMPVTITYICSGLTSLNKGVRRDALSLLLAIANVHSHILIPYMEKLVAHALALLVDPGQAGGQDSLGSTSSAIFVSSGGSVSKAKLDESWKKGATSRKIVENVKPSTNQRPPLLMAVLEVIDAVLTSASHLSERSDHSLVESVMSLKADSNSHFKQAIVLRPVRRTCLHQKVGRIMVNSVTEASSVVDKSGSLLSAGLIADLCHRLNSVWRGLVLGNPVVAAHTVEVLILVAKVSYRLGEAFHCVHTQEFKTLVGGMFSKFPHSSLEASLAAPGSARERSSNLKISVMDLHLCDVALLFYGTEGADSEVEKSNGLEETHSKVNGYLMQKLQLYVEETARELTRNGLTNHADIEDNSMDVDEDVETKLEKNEEQELQTFTTSYSNISVRLFRAIQVVTLAAGRNELNSRRSDVVDDVAGSWSMSVLLNTLRELMEAFVLASAPTQTPGAPPASDLKFSRRSLLAAVEPTLRCLFSIASDTSLWSGSYLETSFTPLAEALAVVSSLIQATDSSDSPSSSSSTAASAFRAELSHLGEAYAHAMLSILRRAPSCSPSEVPESRAMELLSSTVRGLFKTPKAAPLSSSSALKGPKTSSFYQYSNANTRFLLLDVFAHTPFGDVLGATKSVLAALSSASTSVEEQRYFLRIAFERRGEMGATEFIEQLFSFLRLNISSRCHGLEDAVSCSDVGVGKKSKDISGRWLAHDVADVLVWCSSAEAPERILSFVAPYLAAIAAPAEEVLCSDTRGTEKGPGPASKKWAKGWMGSYACSVASIALCSRLLTPLLEEYDMEPVAAPTVQTMSLMCISVMVVAGDARKETSESNRGVPAKKGKEAVNSSQLLGPAIKALCLRSSPSSATPSASPSEDVERSYFVLKAVLAELNKKWSSLSVRQCTNILNSLLVVLTGSEEAVTMRLVCSVTLTSTFSSLVNQASEKKKGVDADSKTALEAVGKRLLDALK